MKNLLCNSSTSCGKIVIVSIHLQNAEDAPQDGTSSGTPSTFADEIV